MSNIIVPVAMEDRVAVAKGIQELNGIQHIKYMSRAMLVNCSGIKDTKLRATLQAMVDDKQIEQYQITENKKLQRYYYTLTAEGSKLLEPQQET